MRTCPGSPFRVTFESGDAAETISEAELDTIADAGVDWLSATASTGFPKRVLLRPTSRRGALTTSASSRQRLRVVMPPCSAGLARFLRLF